MHTLSTCCQSSQNPANASRVCVANNRNPCPSYLWCLLRGVIANGSLLDLLQIICNFFAFYAILFKPVGWHCNERNPFPFLPPSHRCTGIKDWGLINQGDGVEKRPFQSIHNTVMHVCAACCGCRIRAPWPHGCHGWTRSSPHR